MAYLTSQRWSADHSIRRMQFPLAGSQKAFKGGMCSALTGSTPGTSGQVWPAQNSSGHIVIGQFAQNVDNSTSTASSYVDVELAYEVWPYWYDNATGAGAVVAAYLFSNVYVQDDHTVTVTAGAGIIAGRVWAIDSSLGVLVQHNQF